MNIKKILAILIVLLALMFCLSAAVSAQKTISLNMTDKTFNGVESISGVGSSFQIDQDGSANLTGQKVTRNLTFSITSDLSSLKDADKKDLQEFTKGSQPVNIKFDNNKSIKANATVSIDGNTLTISGNEVNSNAIGGEIPKDAEIKEVTLGGSGKTIVKLT